MARARFHGLHRFFEHTTDQQFELAETKGPRTARLLAGFGRSARTRGWAVLDGLRSKELNCVRSLQICSYVLYKCVLCTFLCMSLNISNQHSLSTMPASTIVWTARP